KTYVPLVQTVLYLQRSHSEAIPKYISERTSYLQVRLEFLRYPHVIQTFFNMSWFGPPVRLTAPSTCTWVGHLVSGLRPLTLALSRLSVATAPLLLLSLASYRRSTVHSTKGTPSPINGLSLLVSTRFQVLFHSPPWVLFTFPSRYLFTIGH